MTIKHTQSVKLAATVAALEEIKLETSHSEHVKVNLTKIFEKHKVSTTTIKALKKLKILGYTSESGPSLYLWNSEKKIDNNLANKVMETTKKIISDHQKGAHARAIEKLSKNPHVTKIVKHDKTSGMDLNTEIHRNQQARTRGQIFTDEMGSIFGYKQLAFLTEKVFAEPTRVVFNKTMIVTNVRLLKFSVDGTKLTVSMHSDDNRVMADHNHLAEFELINTVLGMKVDSTKSDTICITGVPVKDPYSII